MKYVKMPIFPLTQYLTAGERDRKKTPAPMEPVSFLFGEEEIQVDRVNSCNRGVSRKVGGRGFRYDCEVSYGEEDNWRTKNSVIWFDDFLLEWFVEVPENRALENWHTAITLNDIGNFLDD